jgi:preprotein translocase subunit SecG
MEQIVLILHMFFAAILIGLVLMQRGKGASMGAAFGSGASQTLFGSRGSIGFLVKVTIIVAALFFATSIALTYMATQKVKHQGDNNLVSQVEQISKEMSEKEKEADKPKPVKRVGR